MSVWIVDGDKIRPTIPECPFVLYGINCRGTMKIIPMSAREDCTIGVVRANGDDQTEECGSSVMFECQTCHTRACDECAQGNWTNR